MLLVARWRWGAGVTATVSSVALFVAPLTQANALATPSTVQQSSWPEGIPALCTESVEVENEAEDEVEVEPLSTSSPSPTPQTSTSPFVSPSPAASESTSDEPIASVSPSVSVSERLRVDAATEEATDEPSISASPDPSPSASPSASPDTSPSDSDFEGGPESDEIDSNDGEAAVVECPVAVLALTAAWGLNSVELSWLHASDAPAVDAFYIEVLRAGVSERIVEFASPEGEVVSSARISGLRNGVEYGFRVFSVNAAGSSEPAGPVTATPSTGVEGVVAGLIVEFEPTVSVTEGSQSVPGDDRVAGVGLTVAETVTDDAVLVEFSEPVDLATAEQIAADLAADEQVAWAEPDQFFFTSSTASEAWNLTGTYGVDAITEVGVTRDSEGAGSTVAVIDTGITAHPDLDAKLVPGYDFVSNPELLASSRQANAPPVAFDGDYIDMAAFGAVGRDDNPSDPGDWSEVAPIRDSSWHGTHIAGVITDVAPGAKIQSVRALSWRGGLLSDIAASITWASGGSVDGVPANANPSKVINMSFAVETICPTALQDAIDAARERGSILVAAAGNASDDAAKYAPGNCNGVITVAATNADGSRADYSNHGASIDISAPGGDATTPVTSRSNTGTTIPDQPGIASDFGTSISAAHVSAAAAILTARNTTITPDEAFTTLTGNEFTKEFANPTCDAINPDYTCGTGILSLAQIAALGDPGSIDYYMTFNGTNQQAIAGSGYYPITAGAGGNFTVEAWVYDTSANDTWNYIAASGTSGSNEAFFMGTIAGSQEIRVSGWSTGAFLATDQWVHIAVSRSGSTATLYMNGAEVAYTSSYGPGVDGFNQPFRVGNYVDGRSEYWEGRIDHVKVYSTALTSAQILTDMQTYSMNASVDSSYHRALYDFNEGSGSTVTNRVAGQGTSSNLTASNSPGFAGVASSSTSGTSTTVTIPRTYLTSFNGYPFPSGLSSATALIVGGGGAGGFDGGGGGGGGGVYEGAVSFGGGGTMTAIVGQGGVSRRGNNPGNHCLDGNSVGGIGCSGNPGTTTQLAGANAGGGGGGGGKNATGGDYNGGGSAYGSGGGGGSSDGGIAARSGGSGTFSGGSGSGWRMGGGGGGYQQRGSDGGNDDNVAAGAGGVGKSSSFSGSTATYGSGGGGGAWACNFCIASAQSGAGMGGWSGTGGGFATPGFGGGGGGGGGWGTIPGYGGSGIIIVRYSTLPDAPTSPTAVAGEGQATVSWTAPTYTGASAISSYTVTASSGGATCTPSPSTATWCTVTGLATGTSYTFTVTATNSQGTGAASVNSNSVTPFGSCTETEQVIGNFVYVAFTGPGGATCTDSWTPPAASMTVNYLVVGGGGGGGTGRGGGGGAGGFLTGSTTITSATSVQIGQGGRGGSFVVDAANNGVQGTKSLLGAIEAAGGGGGGGWNAELGANGGSGGSGGGASGSTSTSRSGGASVSGQGNSGGSNGSIGPCPNWVATSFYCAGGGGGGASSAGSPGSTSKGGDGGAGASAPVWLTSAALTALSIPSAYSGGGGGGGLYVANSTSGGAGGSGGGGAGCGGGAGGDCNGVSGVAMTGGGGGGGEGGTGLGGAGGAGLVVIRYSANELSLSVGAGMQPGNYTYNTGWVTAPRVQLVDATGVAMSTPGVAITATFTATSGSATLSSATQATNANGVADFSGMTLTGNAGTVGTLTFTALDYASVTSTSFSIAKASQATLALTSQNSVVYGDTFTLTTSGGSGTGAMEFQQSGGSAACLVSNGWPSPSTLTGSNGAGGSCEIYAIKAADTNYQQVISAAQYVSVTARPITITASSPSVTYPTAITQTYSITSGSPGLSDSISGMTYTYSGTGSTTYGPSTTAPTAVGTYSVTPSAMTLSASRPTSNYDVQYVAGTVTIAQGSQTITFGSIVNKTYGAAPFSVSATSDSGLPVTLTSTTTDVCTVSGSVVTIVGSALGGATCSITASQAGNANIAAASDITQTFTVSQATQATLSMSSASSAIYGQTISVAAVGGSGSGSLSFSVTSPIGPGLCSLSGTILTLGDAGSTCKVQATKAASANYSSATSAEQTITITQAGQTLAFTSNVPTNPEFGDTYTPTALAMSTVTGSSSGVTPSFTASGNCTISGGEVTFGLPGSCTITASAASNTNFTAATNVTQLIEIGMTNQTITFTQPSNVPFGSASVAMSASTSSGGEVTFALGGGTTNTACAVSSLGVVTILAVGTCEVVASSASFDQYAAASDVTRAFQVVAALPTAPTLTSASASSQAITLSFAAPGFAGGVSITGYQLVATPTGVGTVVASTACASSPCTIPGLTNGTEYTVTVAAINSAGTGPTSSSSTPLTPATAAFAVLNLSAVPGPTVVDVDWDAPADLGGGTFTRYELYYKPVTSSSYVLWANLTPDTNTSDQVTGLDNGTSYDFKVVTITTANGSEIPGNTAEVVQYPSTVPTAPQDPTVLASTATQVQFSWSAPLSDGGAQLTAPPYSVTVTGSAGAAAVTCSPSGVNTYCTASGLTNGASYVFSVVATNRMGNSPAATVTYNVPSSVATLSNLVLTSSSGSVALTPSFASGTTSYSATVVNGVTSVTVTPTTTSAGASVTVSGVAVVSGSASLPIALSVGANTVPVVVTASDPRYSSTYTVTITRVAASGGSGNTGSASDRAREVATPPSSVLSGSQPGGVLIDGQVDTSAVFAVNGSNSGWSVSDDRFGFTARTESVSGAPIPMSTQGVMQVPQGGWIVLSGSSYLPASDVNVFAIPRNSLGGSVSTQGSVRMSPRSNPAAIYLGSTVVSASGNFNATLNVPMSLMIGLYVLQVNGVVANDQVASVNILLNVTPGSPVMRSEQMREAAFYEGASSNFSANGKAKLRAMVAALPTDAQSMEIVVVGVSTALDTPRANLRLARERAENIVEYLKKSGVQGTVTISLSTSFDLQTFERSKKLTDVEQPMISGRGKPLTTLTIDYLTPQTN